ncbi:MAG TPA: hypothetical protein ENG87_05035 [Candidatus Pacearchaeota archaeon]|nr:hypothetical protein [Candidatus Pacearchaeota archaeon]
MTKKNNNHYLAVCNILYASFLVLYILVLIKFLYLSTSFKLIIDFFLHNNSLTLFIGLISFLIFILGFMFSSYIYEKVVSLIFFGVPEKVKKKNRLERIEFYKNRLKKLEGKI